MDNKVLKYLQDVLTAIEGYGNFKIPPITDEDEIVKKNIRQAVQEVKAHISGEMELPRARELEL